MLGLFSPPVLRYFKWCIALFFVMFLCRLTYGYFYPGRASDPTSDSADFSGSRKNYASEKRKEPPPPQQPGGPVGTGSQSQKYEKIATLRAKTNQWEQDEAAIKNQIKAFGAVVQYEQNSGNPGQRTLQLLIGIPPAQFDSFSLSLQKIGRLLSKTVTKTDKTNEYLELNAKRISLEKTRNALLELKSRGGKIDEYIGLENRILEIEGELQGLGVSLGDYDEENEFCTVRCSLLEGAERKISLAQRLKAAFEWTVLYYTLLMLGMLFALGAAYLLVRVLAGLGKGEKG